MAWSSWYEPGMFFTGLFVGFVDKNKKKSKNVQFGCGRVHIYNNVRNIGMSYKWITVFIKARVRSWWNYWG